MNGISLTFILCLLHLNPILSIWPAPRHITQGKDTILLSPNFTIGPSNNLNGYRLPTDLQLAIRDTIELIQDDLHQALQTNQDATKLNERLDQQASEEIGLIYKLDLEIHRSFHQNWFMNSIKSLTWNNLKFKFNKKGNQTKTNHTKGFDFDHLKINGIRSEILKPLDERDESYELIIGPDPRNCQQNIALLSASNSLGLLRGLQTFSQLVYITSPSRLQSESETGSGSKPNQNQNELSIQSNQELCIPNSSNSTNDQTSSNQDQYSLKSDSNLRYLYGPLKIKDTPAFPYRGILLDTSRNFYPISDLKRTLKAMSWSKLSIFHWHITDAQSWPLQLPFQSVLSQHGAYSIHQVYSIQEIKDLVGFANSIGIDVMIEIDTPGHTSVIGEAFPELIACKDAEPWNLYAAEPPAGQLRIADDQSLELVKEIYKYVTTEIPGSLFSSGGDEVNHKCYEDDPETQESLRSQNITLNEALSNFVKKSHEIINLSKKNPVVWEELILDESLDLDLKTIVSVWRSSKNVKDVIEKGYRIIHAASDFGYLDCGLGGWLGKAPEGNSWCDPFKTWQKIYSFDPYGNITHTQRKLVLGGQVSLWSEQADPQNLDSLIWPRALAAAELYWTGKKDDDDDEVEPKIEDRLADALPRLHDMRYRYVRRGIRATALQPHWCAIRPGKCDLIT
ncbi:family 20 glycoside hydrolase [Melampsora larici-populina 98AG31]|uniref:Beta-hexosaminidase n=1 Tax=Melampsora larici-populina (strain 98AG31 / pathotype 3-4-7) TaxID=747676 RepID=F4RSZ7_MELLP|nr:family 20 glycoside hydrolase [Melampsora larici-populina 98AG31]EGG04517.1 family 20 glycoside hydrolase [Melampsora larici-populina 98AG31]